MFRYPGGTPLNHARTTRYSLTSNFLSDLGMTVAYNGARNRAGAAMFAASVLLLVLAFASFLFTLVRLCMSTRRARPWAVATSIVGMVACAAFVGVALTPENAARAVHVMFTIGAWRLIAMAAVLLAATTAAAGALTVRGTLAMLFLSAMLLAYVGVIAWGPATSTSWGLEVQVVAQKTIAATVTVCVLWLTFEIERGITRMPAGNSFQELRAGNLSV
jgi:hypothetical membrane protein